MSDVSNELQQRLVEHGQEHVLKFWDELTEAQRSEFVCQLNSIDYSLLKQKQQNAETVEVLPAPVFALDNKFKENGVERIAKGEFGVLTVAGGQGTRLGWSGPKGTFPATQITGKSLFQLVAEQIVYASKKYKVSIPWYIMTSIENDAVTRSFLLDNNCFGLDRTDIFMFTQGEMPAINEKGKILLASKCRVAMNPDGHGGVIAALKRSGVLDEMEARGVRYLSYVQIDNPLAKAIDPTFLGIHLCDESSNEVTSKCVRKTKPDERVGVFCVGGDKTNVVEYSDLPFEKSVETDGDGKLCYWAGSTALHILSTEFLQRIADDLPWHVANKKVPYIDLDSGELITPEEPNAFKFERFVFDVLPLASSPLVVETDRFEEFAPIKNAEGDDSPKTSHVLQSNRAIRWLRERGIDVSESAIVEISPLTAATAEDLLDSELPTEIKSNEMVVF